MKPLAQTTRVLQGALDEQRGQFFHMLPAWKPSLKLAATRAIDATVNDLPNRADAVEAFREQLEIETGLTRNLVWLLVQEGVLA